MGETVTQTRLPFVAPETALAAAGAVWVDLRSPGEFADDHAPGAVNVPLFDDDERALVGTLYRRRSPEVAFEAGRAITVTKVAELVSGVAEAAGWTPAEGDLTARVERFCADGIAGLDGALEPHRCDAVPERPVLVSCARGGLRSRSVLALLRELGLARAVGVEDGYKGYRRAVRERLAAWEAPPCFVLRGLTGVGKTLVLRALEQQRPGWTLDLEGVAGHRSSILGMVGLAPVTQKTFETRLRERLDAGFPGRVVLEGESRKVGDVTLPAPIWDALQRGTNLELTAPLDRRVAVLIDDYLADEANRAHLARQLPFIEERLGARKWGGVLVDLLETHREEELVALLLERYYDPLYRHSERGRTYAVSIDTRDPERAAHDVASWIEEHRGSRQEP
jgi:tRNA 2-selenouridine synthase